MGFCAIPPLQSNLPPALSDPLQIVLGGLWVLHVAALYTPGPAVASTNCMGGSSLGIGALHGTVAAANASAMDFGNAGGVHFDTGGPLCNHDHQCGEALALLSGLKLVCPRFWR